MLYRNNRVGGHKPSVTEREHKTTGLAFAGQFVRDAFPRLSRVGLGRV